MASIKTVNGLALASMKTFDGLAAASIKTIDGLDATTGGATPTVIASVSGALGANGGTSSDINTTGANFIVVAAAWYNGHDSDITFSDSKGNSYTQLTATSVTDALSTRLYWYQGTNVGSGHNFTTAGTSIFASIAVIAFNNIASSPFDLQSAASSSTASTQQPGSITPSQANTVLISGMGASSSIAVSASINSSFTIQENLVSLISAAIAYKILFASTPTNPTWDVTNPTNAIGATIASFKF